MSIFKSLERFKQYEDYPKKSSTRKHMKIWFSRRYLSIVLKRDSILRCHYCRRRKLRIQWTDKPIHPNRKATIDHIVPISQGGKIFDVTNLVVACECCNQKKGIKSYEEFINQIKNVKTIQTY